MSGVRPSLTVQLHNELEGFKNSARAANLSQFHGSQKQGALRNALQNHETIDTIVTSCCGMEPSANDFHKLVRIGSVSFACWWKCDHACEHQYNEGVVHSQFRAPHNNHLTPSDLSSMCSWCDELQTVPSVAEPRPLQVIKSYS
jgi:hypothetical protein